MCKYFERSKQMKLSPHEEPKQSKRKPPALGIANFVEQYYQTSTFHHLSAWRANLQHNLSQITSNKPLSWGSTPPDLDKEDVEENEYGAFASDAGQVTNKPTLFSPALNNSELPHHEQLPPTEAILHVDMDAFYVRQAAPSAVTIIKKTYDLLLISACMVHHSSVAVRDNPSLLGKPVAICPSKNINGTSGSCSLLNTTKAFIV